MGRSAAGEEWLWNLNVIYLMQSVILVVRVTDNGT